MATILLPKSTLELLNLSESIILKYEKSHEFNKSKDILIDENIQNLKVKVNGLRERYDEMLFYREKAESINREIQLICGTHNSDRKISPGTVKFIIAQLRDILKGLYRENPLLLNEWGFFVSLRKQNKD